MNDKDAALFAGEVLRQLIKENFPSQEEFAYEYHADIRTINRYINEGIGKVRTLQELAIFFGISMKEFIPD